MNDPTGCIVFLCTYFVVILLIITFVFILNKQQCPSCKSKDTVMIDRWFDISLWECKGCSNKWQQLEE